MNEPAQIININDYEETARRKLDPAAFAFIAGGAWDEITLRENVRAFQGHKLRPRVLVDISSVDTATEMLGTPVSMPVALAPAAFQGLAHPEAEIAPTGAAASRNVIFTLAAMSSCSLEEVAASAPGPRWFQLYVHKDRDVSKDLLQRASGSGFEAVMVTVDAPIAGYRERELRSGFTLPPGGMGSFADIDPGGRALIPFITSLHDQSLTWDDLGWIRSAAGLPLIVKGILTGEDAGLAVEHGADAIVVSNHGGRQLDNVPASIDVLEEVVDATQGRVEVYLDGGVRRGTDVVAALALGARGVLLCRPYLFAMAADGRRGIETMLDILQDEIRRAMGLLGAASPDKITRSHVN